MVPIRDLQDEFFYLTFTLMIDSYIRSFVLKVNSRFKKSFCMNYHIGLALADQIYVAFLSFTIIIKTFQSNERFFVLGAECYNVK